MIRNVPVFFVGTANFGDGKNGEIDAVNVSPKGGVPLHIIGPNRVAYLDYTGSGNETARHSEAGSPVTVMICAFEEEKRWNRAPIRTGAGDADRGIRLWQPWYWGNKPMTSLSQCDR